MLQIIVENYDGDYVEYEWETLSDFLADMDNDSDDVPMFDYEIISVRCKDYPHLNKMAFDDVYELYDFISGEDYAYDEEYDD